MASPRSDLSTQKTVVLTSKRSINFRAGSWPSLFKMKVTTSAKTMSEITATARCPSISEPNALARSCCASGRRTAAIQKLESTKTSLPTIDLLVEVLGRVARWTFLHQSDDGRKIQRRGAIIPTFLVIRRISRLLVQLLRILLLSRLKRHRQGDIWVVC